MSRRYPTLFLLLMLLFQHPQQLLATCSSSQFPVKLDISLQDSDLDDQQLVSVYCGEETSRMVDSSIQGMDQGMREIETGTGHRDSLGGNFYMMLNDTDFTLNSTNLTGLSTSINQNGSLSVMFYISKLEEFAGVFMCGYNATNTTGVDNSTKELMFVYRTDGDGQKSAFLALFIVFFVLFVITLLVTLVASFIFTRKQFMMRLSKYTQSKAPISSNSTSTSPLSFTAMGYAVPSCISLNRSHTPRAREDHSRDLLSEETVNELLGYLSHPTRCEIFNCPCAKYKQKLADRVSRTTNERSVYKTVTEAPTSFSEIPIGTCNYRSSTMEDSGIEGSINQPMPAHFAKVHPPTIRDDSTFTVCASPVSSEVTYPIIDAQLAQSGTDYDLKEMLIDSETVDFDYRGGEYVNTKHDVCLKVPKGAVPENSSISIEVGISLHSSLVPLLPSGKTTISPLVKFCVVGKPNYRFVKPVEITLPHFMDISDSDDERKLGLEFMKVGHGLYCFHSSDGQASFQCNSNTATLITQHFCTFCITANEDAISNENTFYRLVKVVPRNKKTGKWSVNFCVSYYLKTCLQALKMQFPESDYELKTHRRFKFAESALLEIQFERKLAGGWQLTLERSNKISPEEVRFCDKDLSELEMMEDDGIYPPRFEVQVCGSHASESVNATFAFRGMAGAGSDMTELLLEPTTSASGNGIASAQNTHLQPIIHSPEPVIDMGPAFIRTRRGRQSIEAVINRSSLSSAPSHSDLMNLVAAVVPAKWRLVGVQLGLTTAKLDEIESHPPHDCKKFFSMVFSEWRSQEARSYTWATIVDALQSPSVEENRVAQDIRLQFPVEFDTILSNRSSASSTIWSSASSGYNTDSEQN